jgi:hypothetical protein
MSPSLESVSNLCTFKMKTLMLLRSRACATLLSLVAIAGLSGCAVVAVADMAVSTVSTVVSTGVKATGAVIDAVIPDSSPKK